MTPRTDAALASVHGGMYADGSDGVTAQEDFDGKIVGLCRQLEREVDALMREKEELREAAKAVVWYDWSDNDEDAVRSIERLRALVREQNT